MRVIKFRGKRPDDGKWVVGDFKHHQRVTSTGLEPTILVDNDPVVLETIGQFTGILDKNGKEIYEGDIVHIHDYTSAYASPYTGKVIMRFGCWCVEYHKQYRCCPSLMFDDFADRKTEVIGNIHDNPELLEGGKE